MTTLDDRKHAWKANPQDVTLFVAYASALALVDVRAARDLVASTRAAFVGDSSAIEQVDAIDLTDERNNILHLVPAPLREAVVPPIVLDDVAGMEHVKKRLRSAFLGPMGNPALAAAFGKSLRGGLLLYGPPGCGKTFIARALAGQLGARFYSVTLADVVGRYLGDAGRNVAQVFEHARTHAPCVLFFDELDGVGHKRSGLQDSDFRGMVTQFLTELDGFGKVNDNVFVVGATNHPWDVDSALRRPGRFDRTLFVPPPDFTARKQILIRALQDRPLTDFDIGGIAAATDRYSGADLVHLVEVAVELALERSIAAGEVSPIVQADLAQALKESKATTLTWLSTAENYAQFANEGGLFDEVAEFLRQGARS